MPGQFITGDIDALFVSLEFGEATATYQGSPVVGIFDDEDIEAQMGEGVTEIIHQPTFTGKSADFSGISDGHTMVIIGETFRVKNWKDDGTGVIEVFLERT